MSKISIASMFVVPMVLSGLIGTEASAKPPTKNNPGIPFPVQMISAGTEMWALLDYVETETFNAGVKAAEKDRIKRNHDTSRSEKWQFSARLEQFHFDGTHFSGLWRSAPFQDKFFVEFIKVEGELDETGKTVRTLRLRKTRFDRASLVEPLNRGVSVIALRFENLPGKAGLGNKSVSYRYSPGTSKVFIEAAWGEHLKTNYHSIIETKWKGFKVDDGANPVTGQKRMVNASVEFNSRGRSVLSTNSVSIVAPLKKVITVKGNWKGLPEVIAWLSSRPGVRIVDHTTRLQDAVAHEREMAKSGLTDTGAIAEEKKESTPYVLEVISAGTDPKDLSAKAAMKGPGGEVKMTLDLDFVRFQQFGEEVINDWISNQTDAFHLEIIAALMKAGL